MEKPAEQVAADTARGLLSCLTNEAVAGTATEAADAGSIEGFRPKVRLHPRVGGEVVSLRR